jgi:hypothetical protein
MSSWKSKRSLQSCEGGGAREVGKHGMRESKRGERTL